MENLKAKIVSDEILLDRYDLSAIKATSSSKETPQAKSIKRLRDSGLWCPLTTLDDSLNTTDKNISMNDEDIMERLNERFSFSPRSFTETLVTIIEESFNRSHEKLDDASQFSPIDFSKSITFLENTSLMADNSSSHESQKSSKKSKVKEGILEKESPLKFTFATPTKSQISVNLERSNVASDGSADKSTTRCLKPPETKVSMSTVQISSKNNKIFPKTPKIIINPATPKKAGKGMPQSRSIPSPSKVIRKKTSNIQENLEKVEQTAGLRKKSLQLSPLNSDGDDEYLAGESETDDSEISGVSTVSTKKTTEVLSTKVNTTKIASEISRNRSVINKASIVKSRKSQLSTHSNKLAKRCIEELSEKRQKCFDLVDEMLKKSDDKQPEVESSFACTKSKLTEEFCNLLFACDNFFQHAKNISEMSDRKKSTGRRYVTSTTMQLKTRKSIGSPGAPRTTKKTRKSLSKSPGARIIATRSTLLTPSSMKRNTSKKPQSSPVVDTSSIRPISQLKRIFSPNPKTTGFSESNENKGIERKTTKKISPIVAEKRVTGKLAAKPLQLKKIVSPVGEYIRGKKTT